MDIDGDDNSSFVQNSAIVASTCATGNNNNHSVESSTDDYEIQDYDDFFQDDEPMAVIRVIITDNASFASLSSINSSASTD